ncbi:GNAT family N-acetyltransferase [Larkinella sp. VNQ87]|uniref:GNAT family N-acetyltransferase n=1 Tax=Larkinella sp. VNQ87 TaxID=3400921 RepID=UPI003C121017
MKVLSLTELTPDQFLAAQALEIHCKSKDGLTGTIHWDKSMNFFPAMRHWFLLYQQDVLIGLLSAFAPTTSQVELGGYILPNARRKGCCSMLLDVVADEARKYDYSQLMLITERASETGQAFVRHQGATYSNTEYQLAWHPPANWSPSPIPSVRLVESTLDTLESMTHLSRSIFGGTDEEARRILETTMLTPHLTQYAALLGEQTVGMVAINYEQNDAWIIGLGVASGFQGQGLGRCILEQTLALLRSDERAKRILIEVDSTNEAALHLYQKAGFQIFMGQDYFRLSL